MAFGRLTITVGLPASGKSTWAEEQRVAAPDKVRVITRDDLRIALGSVYEQGDERVVVRVRDTAIKAYLYEGYHVICADTNLDGGTQKSLERLTKDMDGKAIASFDRKDFTDVSLHDCLRRNQERWARGDYKVPDAAIISMHDRYIKNS